MGKYTVKQLREAAQIIKETCQEHSADCWSCPLESNQGRFCKAAYEEVW